MNVRPTALAGVFVADTATIADHRGQFSRLYCERELAPAVGDRRIVQINHSRTNSVGAVRGLHAQRAPHAEMKLIRCTAGRVWDVAVDFRQRSPTFLHWHAEELSAKNGSMMIIPEGCAHGFQVLEPQSELLYLHTAFYTPVAEWGARADDPLVGINWPLPIAELSDRDRAHPLLTADFSGLAESMPGAL